MGDHRAVFYDSRGHMGESRRQLVGLAARSNGTAASPSPSPSCSGTPTTVVRPSSSSVYRSPAMADSIRPSSATPPVRPPTMRRHSSGPGTTWPASAPRFLDVPTQKRKRRLAPAGLATFITPASAVDLAHSVTIFRIDLPHLWMRRVCKVCPGPSGWPASTHYGRFVLWQPPS